jgi:hypothetical protein
MLRLSTHAAHCNEMSSADQGEEARQYLIDAILEKENFQTLRDRKSPHCKKRMEFLQSKSIKYLLKIHG